MFFFSQDNFEHVDFHLPAEKKVWYRLKHDERRGAAASIAKHPRSEEHDEVLKHIFGHDSAGDYIAQMKQSEKNKHWTFLFHDAQEIQLVLNEAKQLTGARFRHDHVSPEAIDLLLDALEKHGYNIYADNFVETGLNITGSKKFIQDAKANLQTQIEARKKLLSKNSIVAEDAPESPRPAATASPLAAAAAAIAGAAALGASAAAAAPTPQPEPQATPAASAPIIVPPATVNGWSNERYAVTNVKVASEVTPPLPELQEALMTVVSNWADYYRNNRAKDIATGKLDERSPAYESRTAEVRFLDELATKLSVAHDENTWDQPRFSYNAVKEVLKKNIGVKGSDPYASDKVEPSWVGVAQNLGMSANDVPISMRPVAKFAEAKLPQGPRQPSAPQNMAMN